MSQFQDNKDGRIPLVHLLHPTIPVKSSEFPTSLKGYADYNRSVLNCLTSLPSLTSGPSLNTFYTTVVNAIVHLIHHPYPNIPVGESSSDAAVDYLYAHLEVVSVLFSLIDAENHKDNVANMAKKLGNTANATHKIQKPHLGADFPFAEYHAPSLPDFHPAPKMDCKDKRGDGHRYYLFQQTRHCLSSYYGGINQTIQTNLKRVKTDPSKLRPLLESISVFCQLLLPSLTPTLSHLSLHMCNRPLAPAPPPTFALYKSPIEGVANVLNFLIENADNVTIIEGTHLRKSIRDQTVDLPGFSGVYSTPQNPPLNHWSPENPPTTPSTSEYSVSPPFPFHTVVDTLVLRGFFPPLVSLLHSVLLNAIPHPEYKEQLLDVFNALAFTSDGYALGARESSLFSTRAGNFPLCIGTAPRYCNHTTSWTCPDFVDVCVGGIRENLLNEGIVETLGGMFKKAVDDEVPADLSHALVNRYCEKVLAGASKDQDDKANDEEDEDALDNSKTTLVDYHIVLPESMSGDTAYKVVSNKHCIYGHSKYIDRLNKNKNKNKYSANVGSKIVLYKKNLGIAARALQELTKDKCALLVALLDSSNYRINKVGMELLYSVVLRDRTKATLKKLLPAVKFSYLLTLASQNLTVKACGWRILGLFFTIFDSLDCIPDVSSYELCETLKSWHMVWKTLGSERNPKEENWALEECLLNAVVWSNHSRLKFFFDEGVTADLIQYSVNRIGDGKKGARLACMALECVHRIMKGVEEGSVVKFDGLSVKLTTPHSPIAKMNKKDMDVSLTVMRAFKEALDNGFKDCSICKSKPCSVKNFMEFCTECKIWRCRTCACKGFHIDSMDWLDEDLVGKGKKKKKGKKAVAEEAAQKKADQEAAEAKAEAKKKKKKKKKEPTWREELAALSNGATQESAVQDEPPLPPPPPAAASASQPASKFAFNLDSMRSALDEDDKKPQAIPGPDFDMSKLQGDDFFAMIDAMSAKKEEAAPMRKQPSTTLPLESMSEIERAELAMQKEMEGIRAETERMMAMQKERDEQDELELGGRVEEGGGEGELDSDSDSDSVEEVLWTPQSLLK